MKRPWKALPFAVLALVVGGLVLRDGSATAAPDTVAAGGMHDTVRLQLKWVTQAQFAGYYLAAAQGFYEQEGIDIEILPGSADLTPEQVVADGGAEFGVGWLPGLLAARDQGLDLVNIAQVFQRSATTQIAWKDSGITAIADLRGRTAGVWCCGNQYELLAALRKSGIDPDNPDDILIVDQPFDMDLFLDRRVDAAAATTYNELAQVLETVNPATGALYTLNDLTILSLEQAGTGMLADGITVSERWIAEPKHQDIAVRFLRASFRGWIYCRDHAEECVQATLAQGPALGAGHQRWMMNEINALIWPSPNGIGAMDPASYERTAAIARQYGVITRGPDGGAVRLDLAQQALAGIAEDTKGAAWQKAVVPVTPGGR